MIILYHLVNLISKTLENKSCAVQFYLYFSYSDHKQLPKTMKNCYGGLKCAA